MPTTLSRPTASAAHTGRREDTGAGRRPTPAARPRHRRSPVGTSAPGRHKLGLGVVLGLVVVSCLAAVLAARSTDARVGPSRHGADSDVAVSAGPTGLAASDVLGEWDRARGRAFAQGDVASLRRLYVAGSSAGTADVRLLRAYLRRGLRVEGMRMQLLALEVLGQGRDRLRLRVTDRLVGAVAVGEGTRIALPRDRASRRVVVLRRTGSGERWRVESVSESAPTPAGR